MSWKLQIGYLCNMCVCLLCHVQPFVIPWTIANQTPLSMEFPRQEILEWVAISYSRGSFQSRGQICLGGGFFTTEPQGKSKMYYMYFPISHKQWKAQEAVNSSKAATQYWASVHPRVQLQI